MTQTINYKGFTIEIRDQDSYDTSSPRDRDNVGHMVMFHNRYTLPNELNLDHNSFQGWNGMQTYLEREYDIVLPISMVDHSGLSFCIGDKSGRDSGQVGYIVANMESGVSKIEMEAILKEEVRLYDQRQRGEIYEYEILEMEVFCGGYYEMSDAIADAKEEIDSYGYSFTTTPKLTYSKQLYAFSIKYDEKEYSGTFEKMLNDKGERTERIIRDDPRPDLDDNKVIRSLRL